MLEAKGSVFRFSEKITKGIELQNAKFVKN